MYEKKILSAAFFAPLVSSMVLAQSSVENDPFNTSPLTSEVDRLGVVTKSSVEYLEDKAREAFVSGDCKEAIPLLDEYSEKSNWLANMIAATLDPFYSASRQDRQDNFSKVRPLIPLESLSNEYKQKRNAAYAMKGECLFKIGDVEGAVPVLVQALKLISINDDEW